MYKVTLFDRNCPSCTSWTAEFYCDNIDVFERKWLQEEEDEGTIERFRRSKNGECVTDYYSDDPSLDIVQYDEAAEVFHTLEESWRDRSLELYNSYRWPATYHIMAARIQLRYVCFQGIYMEQASYRLEGACMESLFGGKKYRPVTCWGNRVLEHKNAHIDASDDRAAYAADVIESFVYFPMKRVETKDELKALYEHRKNNGLSDQELDMLLQDIPGEAG